MKTKILHGPACAYYTYSVANPNVKAIEELPKLIRESIVKQIIAGVPLRRIADEVGLSDRTVRRFKDDVVMPKLDANLPFSGSTPQATESKAVIEAKAQQVAASCQETRVIGEVQAQVIALRKRAENVLTRVESRPDEEFSGREWASVATVAARMIETQGRMTGELSDRAGGGDVNIQINMPTTARQEDGRTIDVDLLKPLKSTDQS